MSTVVMPQTTVYDFGDLLLKSAQGGFTKNTSDSGTTPLHQLAVGGPTLSPRQLHNALSRVSSSPAAALVSSLLDNLNHRRLERTQSAPVATANPIQASTANTSRYKTELCRPFEESGSCKYGDKCQFAHGLAELRSLARHPKYKTELCRTYHTVGFCPYGPRCHFVHNQEEARIHNRAVAAFLAARVGKSRPPALSPSLSMGSADSPNSSLSQSPTSSLGSFFSSESELLHSPAVSPSVSLHTSSPSPPPISTSTSTNTTQPQVDAEWRLPVFNRLSANILALGDLVL